MVTFKKYRKSPRPSQCGRGGLSRLGGWGSQDGQGGQVGQVVGMLGSSSQHNVLSENKRVYNLRVLLIKYKRKCEITRL